MERVTITISPAPGADSLTVADAMLQVLDAIRLLADAARGVDEPGAAELEWRLEKASANSPLVVTALAATRSPDLDAIQLARQVKREFGVGLRNLAERGQAAYWMDPDTLRTARALLGRTKNGIGSTVIELDPGDAITFDRALAETTLERIQTIEVESMEKREAYGELEGVLVSVGQYYRRPSINLHNRMYGAVVCRLDTTTINQFGGEHRLKEVWDGKLIGATGKLVYNADGGLRYIEVDPGGLREVPGEPPINLDEIADPEFTAGLDPVEYVRRLHEGELA